MLALLLLSPAAPLERSQELLLGPTPYWRTREAIDSERLEAAAAQQAKQGRRMAQHEPAQKTRK